MGLRVYGLPIIEAVLRQSSNAPNSSQYEPRTRALYMGSIIGIIKEDTRRLDYSSYAWTLLGMTADCLTGSIKSGVRKRILQGLHRD